MFEDFFKQEVINTAVVPLTTPGFFSGKRKPVICCHITTKHTEADTITLPQLDSPKVAEIITKVPSGCRFHGFNTGLFIYLDIYHFHCISVKACMLIAETSVLIK